DGVNATGPRARLVPGALRLEVLQVLVQFPALSNERVAEGSHAAGDGVRGVHVKALRRADVEPDTKGGLDAQVSHLAEDRLVVPIHRRRKQGDFAKRSGVFEPDVERDERSQ